MPQTKRAPKPKAIPKPGTVHELHPARCASCNAPGADIWFYEGGRDYVACSVDCCEAILRRERERHHEEARAA